MEVTTCHLDIRVLPVGGQGGSGDSVSWLLWQPPGGGTILLGGGEGASGKAPQWRNCDGQGEASGRWRMEKQPPRGRAQQGAKAQSFWRMVLEGASGWEKKLEGPRRADLSKDCFFLAKGGRSVPSGHGAEPVSGFRAQRTP